MRIYWENFQSSTPLVIAKFGERNLFVSQLFWGLNIQKYEGNIGDNYPEAGVIYRNSVQAKLDRSLLKEKYLENLKQLP